jgi:hypothetical protein
MISFVFLGAATGALLAYAAIRPMKEFRKRLLLDYESHVEKGSQKEFISELVRDRRQWVKSISVIRRPFRSEVNLAVETVAFILAIVGVFNSFVHFDRYFKSSFQGEVVLVFLAAVAAFIPVQWFFNTRIDRDVECTFSELKRALLMGELETYMTRARKKWR